MMPHLPCFQRARNSSFFRWAVGIDDLLVVESLDETLAFIVHSAVSDPASTLDRFQTRYAKRHR
jgi:hypothetical protein